MKAHNGGFMEKLRRLVKGRKKATPTYDLDEDMPRTYYRYQSLVYRMPIAVQ
jgi:hypothetical protein